MIKKLLAITIIASAGPLTSCANFQSYVHNDAAVTTAIATATSACLRYGIQNAALRTKVANYIDVYAGSLRTLTGNPTLEQLTVLLNQAVPANVRADIPELTTFVYPLIISNYQLFAQYASSAYHWGNDAAVGLETGAAPYISHVPPIQ
jgi:hypothetical protein